MTYVHMFLCVHSHVDMCMTLSTYVLTMSVHIDTEYCHFYI